MIYKISIKTDGDFFTVDCCEFEHFADAKARVGKMVVDLMTSHIEHDFVGCWEEFKEEFPEEVLSIIESFEYDGVASASNSIEGDTDNYHYVISGNTFKIYDSDDGEYAPTYALQTNMLGMNGDEEEYRFRLWSSIDGGEQALTICLNKYDGFCIEGADC